MQSNLFKFFLLAGGCWLVCFSTGISAAGAGVLVSARIDNQRHILLADHKKVSQVSRGWSSLGGTIKENETELSAAIREVVEESNGILTDNELFAAINPEIKTVTPGFTIYYAEIPNLAITQFNCSSNKEGQECLHERGPFIWIPWQQVLQAAEEYRQQKKLTSNPKIKLPAQFLPKQRQTDWFFNAFLNTVESISMTTGHKLNHNPK